ncbi:hypothetical protein JOB18_030136 [Solea senegalensis]|uniref:Uncharacterized protein n=1 Tax=Solea senegalensis TaxID=28829 RepID=A0AAV6SJA8_SOLSE|nr:hypothetical protein JOB18_030136 [Solea senegalensis]
MADPRVFIVFSPLVFSRVLRSPHSSVTNLSSDTPARFDRQPPEPKPEPACEQNAFELRAKPRATSTWSDTDTGAVKPLNQSVHPYSAAVGTVQNQQQ